MKQLPCTHCRGPAYGKLGPIEVPLIVGRVSHFPYRYKCCRCKQLNTLQAREYNLLPTLAAVSSEDQDAQP